MSKNNATATLTVSGQFKDSNQWSGSSEIQLETFRWKWIGKKASKCKWRR